MVTIKGTKAFPAGSKSRSWCIQVFPRLHPIIDELEHCRLTDSGAAFVFNLTFGFNEDGRPLKTTQSTLGNIVENGSRELCDSTEASFTETIQTVVENVRCPSSGVGQKLAKPVCSSDDLVSFLSKPDYVSQLRLWVVTECSFQFRMVDQNTPVPMAWVDQFMHFSQVKFGSFATKKILKQHRNDYKETGFIEIGYVGLEESC